MGRAVAMAQQQPWTLPPRGRVGIVSLIAAESAIFIIFVIAYLYYIGKSPTGPTPQQVLSLPILNTICLLSSSVTIVVAIRALRNGQLGAFKLWWLVTILLGLEFLIGTGREWYGLIYGNGLTIATNLFGTTFYSLVGLHATHVIVGLIILSIVMALAVAGHMSARYTEHAEVVSWYWHFVDTVWIVVFTVVYVIGR